MCLEKKLCTHLRQMFYLQEANWTPTVYAHFYLSVRNVAKKKSISEKQPHTTALTKGKKGCVVTLTN
jgi:hypothetical protein